MMQTGLPEDARIFALHTEQTEKQDDDHHLAGVDFEALRPPEHTALAELAPFEEEHVLAPD